MDSRKGKVNKLNIYTNNSLFMMLCKRYNIKYILILTMFGCRKNNA